MPTHGPAHRAKLELVIAVDHDGGWDMHTDLGALSSGDMLGAAGSLGTSLAAFFTDLGSWADRVTVVTITEFGRRIRENGNFGVDHGYGGVMFLLGGGVKGGYYADWPGLVDEDDAVRGRTCGTGSIP